MLAGDLADFSLPDILGLLASTAKSGRLSLVTSGGAGRVELVAGRIRDASADATRLPLARRLLGRRLVDGATLRAALEGRTALPTDLELAGALAAGDVVPGEELREVLREHTFDAIFDLVRWSEGTFGFEVADVASSSGAPSDLAVDLDVGELLDEASRRLAVWAAIDDRTGPGDAVVTVTAPGGSPVELDGDGWQLLGLADGRRTVDDLVTLSGRGQFDTRSTLATLLELGVVSVGTQQRGLVERLLADQETLVALERGLCEPAAESVGGGSEPPLKPAPLVEVGGSPVRDGIRPDPLGRRSAGDPAIDVALVDRLIAGVEAL